MIKLILIATFCMSIAHAQKKDDPFSEPRNKPPAKPKGFAFVFAMPYGISDEFPRDEKEFERMLVLLKGAGFNTVYCPYTDWRHKLFKKHGMKMMIDVLAWKPPVETDIRRNEEQRKRVEEICKKCKGSDAIWGYNLWNERLDWFGDFKKLDLYLRMLRTWDPTHPVWVGTYRYLYCEHFPTFPGVHAYYDYHWKRGMAWNFHQLNFYRGICKKRKSSMGRWMLITDYNRNLYTLNTSIAHGLKTVIWFIGGPYAAREKDVKKRWHEEMHLVKLGRHVQPLYPLIGEMGPALEVYSTPTKREPANTDKPLKLPASTTAFPEDHWLQIEQGEVLCGFFKLKDKAKSDVVYVANHNAFAWQGVIMSMKQDRKHPRVAFVFDREKKTWKRLGAVETINFPIPPADAVALKFETVSPKDVGKAPPNDPPKAWTAQGHLKRIGDLLNKQNVVADAKPSATFSTPTTRTSTNEKKEAGIPNNLQAVPEDFWLQIKQGEMLCGVFKLKDGASVVCFANHNGVAWQGGLIVPKQNKANPTMIWELDQKTNEWARLGTWGDVNFPLKPAGSAVFKFAKPKKE